MIFLIMVDDNLIFSIQNLLRQQHKSIQQHRVILSQRIKALKQLHEQYNRSLIDLDKAHQDQHINAQGEIKKELAQLQKRMLMDTVRVVAVA